jgi:hypothetical protein
MVAGLRAAFPLSLFFSLIAERSLGFNPISDKRSSNGSLKHLPHCLHLISGSSLELNPVRADESQATTFSVPQLGQSAQAPIVGFTREPLRLFFFLQPKSGFCRLCEIYDFAFAMEFELNLVIP